MEQENPQPKENKIQLWLKRFGVAGFLFFFVKGLFWIAIFLGAGKCAFG